MLTGLDGKWTNLAVKIDVSEAFRYLGQRGQQAGVTPAVMALANQMRDLATELAEPRGIGFMYRVSEKSTGLVIGDSLEISGPRTCHRLGPIAEAYLFAVTIGDNLESQVSKLFMQGEYAKGAILDSMGSVAVESLAESVNQVVRDTAEKAGFQVTPRLSPGYGDWPLTAQFTLFPLTGGGQIGISLNEAGLLVPRKSITGLIGIRRVGLGEQADTTCACCLLTDCRFRCRGDYTG